jgi:hypothetical protein
VLHALKATSYRRERRRIDNKILKVETTRPATQPTDDAACWRHRAQERITM